MKKAVYLVGTRHNACAGLCRNRKKSHFSFFQLKNFKATIKKLVYNPSWVQMLYSELKFMQWVINASQYTRLRCKLVSSYVFTKYESWC